MMNIATVDRSRQNLELTLHYTLISKYYIHMLILANDDNVGTSLSKLIDKVCLIFIDDNCHYSSWYTNSVAFYNFTLYIFSLTFKIIANLSPKFTLFVKIAYTSCIFSE